MNSIFLILLITILVSAWFFMFDSMYDVGIIVSLISIITGLIIAGLALRLSLRYSKTICLGKALMILGVAFLFYSAAESVWLQLDMYDIDGYPSTAEIFYFGYDILLILFLITIFRAFVNKHSFKSIVFIILCVSTVTVFYYALSYGSEFDYVNLGGIYVILSSFIAATSITLAFRFHSKGVKTIWILFAFAMTVNCIGDISYYIVENIYGYNYNPTIDTMWFAGNLLLIILLLRYEYYEKKTKY